ncbi:MAG: hypothetical protein IPK84_01615 [Candidatus Moraniibacteriota bacterium]|nr:MAG: hypothetical protein IPK84_01615 [Candidatus Moranbacteria bacterium]
MTNKSSGINVGGMIKWAFGGLVLGFVAGLFTSNISWTAFWITMILFVVVFGFMGAKSKRKEEKKAYASSQFISDEKLTTNQKIAAWTFSIINPVITGAVMYYMWRCKYPTKARQANHISIIVFLVELAIGFFIAFSGGA